MRLRFLSLITVVLLACSGCTNQAEEWYSQGESHHAMGNYEEAVIAFDHAIELDPGYGKAWSHRGLSLSMLGREQESEDSFSRALSLAPDDIETYYFQALARYKTGNRTGALESLERATGIGPQSRDDAIVLGSCFLLRGDILTLEGRNTEANASYNRAHELMMGTL